MLKLDGKPFVKERVSQAVQQLETFLIKAPADEIFSRIDLISKKNYSRDCMDKLAVARPDLTRLWQCKRYYGSPKAIAAFDKEVGA